MGLIENYYSDDKWSRCRYSFFISKEDPISFIHPPYDHLYNRFMNGFKSSMQNYISEPLSFWWALPPLFHVGLMKAHQKENGSFVILRKSTEASFCTFHYFDFLKSYVVHFICLFGYFFFIFGAMSMRLAFVIYSIVIRNFSHDRC